MKKKKKMSFKLGNEGRSFKNASNVSIRRRDAGDNALAQANMDGSIDVDPSINLNSPLGRRVIKHENKHLEQIESGRAAYDDNWVMWEGKLYIRQNGYIDGPNGKFPEGDNRHPREQEAVKAEKNNN